VIGRDAPNVVGDGVRTVRELIELKNESRRQNPAVRFRPIKIDNYLESYLARSGLTLDSVPRRGAKVYVGGAANITIGGDSIDCADTVPDVVKQAAVDAVRAVPGLRWGGVDIMLRSDSTAGSARTPDALVLEINVNSGISSFHYPVFGRPRDAAGQLWSTRWRWASSNLHHNRAVQPSARRRLQAPPPPTAGAEPPRPSGRVDLTTLLAARVAALGGHAERLASNLVLITRGDQRHLMYGLANDDDLTVVAQVLKRRAAQRRLLRRAGVPTVPGRTVRSLDDAREFLTTTVHPVAVLPTRDGPDRSAIALVGPRDESAMARAWNEAVEPPVSLHARPVGHRFRVFATRDEAPVVIGVPEPALPDLDERGVARLEEIAVHAVRAIPELRWAAVDLVVPGGDAEIHRSGEVLVEHMTTDPTVRPTDQIVAGSLEAFVDAVLPAGLTGLGSKAFRAARRPLRWWRRR
jgi:D-alanine-D-alanine ligase-like ATP-grasp enzyme